MLRVLILVLAFGLVACEPPAPEGPAPLDPVEEPAVPAADIYGADFDYSSPMPLEAISAVPEQYVGEQVTVAGTVRKVCQKKGCWLTLDAGSGDPIRVTFRDYGFFVPMDLPGREVVLQGDLQQTTVDVEVLRHYAEESGQSQDEVATITEPKIELSVIADGVAVVG